MASHGLIPASVALSLPRKKKLRFLRCFLKKKERKVTIGAEGEHGVGGRGGREGQWPVSGTRGGALMKSEVGHWATLAFSLDISGASE